MSRSCHFGLEAVLKREEILDLGYEISEVEETGRVTFYGDADAICLIPIFSTHSRAYSVEGGSFQAVTFEELFDKTKRTSVGKTIFHRMVNSGWQKRLQLRVAISARQIFSPL